MVWCLSKRVWGKYCDIVAQGIIVLEKYCGIVSQEIIFGKMLWYCVSERIVWERLLHCVKGKYNGCCISFSLVAFGLTVHSVVGLILLWGNFPVEGIFPLSNMGSNSIPPKALSDESINRGLVCAHMHFIARTQKILTLMS